MAVLIDPPQWPAHGTRFSHLVSDASLGELLEFADANGLPVRAFDHDHYDVPERRYGDLVAAGAEPVAASRLLRRLVASGLRVRTPQRTPKPAAVLPSLRAAWQRLLPQAPALGAELLRRWREPHRHYHDVRHLAQLLDALDLLTGAAVPRPVALAGWFHDAVYAGHAGEDEERSARLAETELPGTGLPAGEIAEVARLVRLTANHRVEPGDINGSTLVDADLSILGQPAGHYHMYARGVRLEYAHVPDEEFAAGRLRVLNALSAREPLFGLPAARAAWTTQALVNCDVERQRWSRFANLGR